MNAMPYTPALVSGPLLTAAQVGELVEQLTRRNIQEAVDYARGEIAACLSLLTMDSLARHSLRNVCVQMKIDPWAPLIDGARATLSGRTDATPVATLTPVHVPVHGLCWVLTNGVSYAKEFCADHRQADDAVVVGAPMQIVTNTGFPTWIDEADIAEATGHPLGKLLMTPAEVRREADLPHEAVTPRKITKVLEGVRASTHSATSAREAARNHDGKFGTQPLSEADVDLDPDDRQDPYFGAIALTAAITEMPGFEQATAHQDGSITTKTIHGYDLALKQDERGRWWSQPIVDGAGIDWGRAYARDRYQSTDPRKALRLTAHDIHMRSEVTERMHRELGFMKTTENTTPEIYSAITLEPEYEDSRTTIVTMDDPVRPGKSTELTAQHIYDAENGIQRGMTKGRMRLTEENCVEHTGARYGQLWDAMHGAATYADASVYGDGTSRLSRHNDATRKLVDEAEDAGYSAFTSRRVDLSDDAQQYSTPTVRISAETAHHFASVEIAGDTGEVQRYFQSRPVDEFPTTARKFRQMEKFALERTEQAKEINTLTATGLTQ